MSKRCRRKARLPQRVESEQSKVVRIGNLPHDVDPDHLLRFLNEAMMRRRSQCRGCQGCGTPIRNCLIHNHVAYVSLTSAACLRIAMGLNGTTYLDRPLHISSPASTNGERLEVERRNELAAALRSAISREHAWTNETESDEHSSIDHTETETTDGEESSLSS